MKHTPRNLLLIGAAVLVLAAAFIAGGGTRSADAAGSPDIDGMWASVYSTTSLQNAGTCVVGIDDASGTLTDTVPMECRNSAGVLGSYNGDLNGTRTGQSVSLTTVSDYSFPPPAILNGSVSGTVSKDGLSGSGTWSHEIGSGTFVSGKMIPTSAGMDIGVNVAYGGLVTFEDVTTGGDTQAIFAPTAAGPLPPNFQLVNWQGEPLYFHVTTTADYVQGSGPNQGVTVCAPYTDLNDDNLIDDSGVNVGTLRILHWNTDLDPDDWENPDPSGSGLDTANNRICVTVEHLSAFAVVAPDTKASFDIAFTTFRDGSGGEIYKMTGGGANQIRLTNNTAYDANPAWSTDGAVIAFTSSRDGNNEIYVMKPDGSGQTRLTNNSASDDLAAWSPDNSKIAFVSDRDGNEEIYVMDADGSAQTRLTNSSDIDTNPSWSPDGTKIAFESVQGGNRDVYVMNADGTGQAALTSDPAEDGYPDWSPDGGKIAFASTRDGDVEIYVMKSDGSSESNLTNSPDFEFDPSWKASSGELVYQFVDADTFASRIFKMGDGGANQAALTLSSDTSLHADWSRVSGFGMDFDSEGCTDAKEAGPVPAKGGLRNPQHFWDFFDVWTGTVPNLTRNKAVAAPDFNAVLSRFGATGTATSIADALTEPSSATGYHAAFDRGAQIGLYSWNRAPANGAIAAPDFNAVLAQFGHNCN